VSNALAAFAGAGRAMRSPSFGGSVGSGGAGRATRHTETMFLPGPVLSEMKLVQDELDNRTILTHLEAALQQGRPRGSVGELDTSTVAVDELQACVQQCDRLEPKTALARQYVDTGFRILYLRRAL